VDTIDAELERRLQRCDALERALDRLNVALFLLDPLGHPVFVNRRGRELLDGDELRLDGERLRGPDGAMAAVLDELICAVCVGMDRRRGAAKAALLPRAGRPPLSAVAIPMDPAKGPAAVVLISDPERGETPEAVLMRLYGLTAAEAATLNSVSAGSGLGAAAARRGVSLQTVKTQLAHIVQKTGARGQAALIRLVLAGPGLIRWD
jgi:DNA-binding CsgD family transcriptional regulator